jgi:hypothetical protein
MFGLERRNSNLAAENEALKRLILSRDIQRSFERGDASHTVPTTMIGGQTQNTN